MRKKVEKLIVQVGLVKSRKVWYNTKKRSLPKEYESKKLKDQLETGEAVYINTVGKNIYTYKLK